MDFSENYYQILGITNKASEKEIKKSYYKLSFELHPDKNKDADVTKFHIITEAYNILNDQKSRKEYDTKSIWGSEYDEKYEMSLYDFDNVSSMWDEDKFKKFKKNDILNIICHVDESFNGSIEYERWVICKKCKGSGKDYKSKIEIKDSNGKVIRLLDPDAGCDFCEGTSKNYDGSDCPFCFGQGKTGSKDCETCKGEKRILGKQKLSGIIFPKNEKDLKVEFMGNFSKEMPGKVGHLWLLRKINETE